MKTAIKIDAIKAQIISKFVTMNKGQFVGFSEYENNSNEIANHVVNANFSYGRAKKEDYEVKLQNMTNDNAKAIVEKLNKTDFFADAPTSISEIWETREKMIEKYLNPKQRTPKQEDCYTPIENTTLKIHNETGEIHAYALAVQKSVLVEGEYKQVNSRRNTRIQNAIKKELGFITSKFRQFKINPDKVCKVSLTGDSFTLK